MTERGFTKSVVEQAALVWLEGTGWQVRSGPEIAPGESGSYLTYLSPDGVHSG